MKRRVQRVRALRAGVVLIVVACRLMFTTVATAKAQAPSTPPCSVGGAPEKVSYPIFLSKPSQPAQVIACGTSFVGPFEIVAYPSVKRKWLCTLFLGAPFGDGDCGPDIIQPPVGRDEIRSFQMGWGGENGSSYTYLSGSLGLDVARVEVRYHRYNKKPINQVNATIAQVNGELLKSLDQTVPFGRFAAVLPGCAVPQGMRIVAFDPEGAIVASERGRKSHFGNPCRGGYSPEWTVYAPTSKRR